MLKPLISPGYFLINAQLWHISPNVYYHCPIYVILNFITKDSRCQVDKKIWITSNMTSQSSCNIQLNPTGKIMMIKQRISHTTSHKWPHQWWIIWKIINHQHKRRMHQSIRILPLWYQIKRRLHHWKVEILQKMVACGLSNIISDHQNSMNS